MRIIEKQEQFMKFICDKYDRDDTFQQYGEYPWSLITESRLNFGDGGAQLAAMELLRKRGWIEIVKTSRNTGRGSIRITTKIRPTMEGILHVQESRQHALKRHWPKVIAATTEGVIKGLRG